MGIEVTCDTCGKDISELRNKEVHCDFCFEDLKDTASNLEDTIFDLKEEIRKLEGGT